MRKLHYDRDRLREAREIRLKWLNGEKTGRMPYVCTVANPQTKGWLTGNPYDFAEACRHDELAVEGQLLSMQWQFDSFPDCDYLPCMQLFHLGEGILASMYGAKQKIVPGNPPFTEGRLLRNIDEWEKLPAVPDIEGSEWGQKLQRQVKLFLEATDGEIPVGVPDYQSPYGTATKLMPNEELILALYDEPELAKRFLSRVTDGIVQLVEKMREWVGDERLCLNTSTPIPGRAGIILWDDYGSVLTPALYEEFCVPNNLRLFERYGHGHLHTCGPYFPGYLEALLKCQPRTMDTSIMRGMSRGRDDLLEFRRVTAAHGVRLYGYPAISDDSIFAHAEREPDEELLLAFMRGGWLPTGGGTVEECVQKREYLAKIYAKI